MSRATKRTRPYHHGNLRASLVEAATALVATRGAPAVTLRAVAHRAGVSHAAVYHHLPDRDAVLAAVVEQAYTELQAAMDAAVQDLARPLERYGALGLAYVHYAFAHPRLYALMFGSELQDRSAHPGLARGASALFDRMSQAIVACQAEGSIAPGPASEHTVFCWSAVHGLVSLVIEDQIAGILVPARSPSALAEMTVQCVFTGLGARPDPGPPDRRRPGIGKATPGIRKAAPERRRPR